MTSSDHLLDLIRSTPEIDLLLRTSFGFDIGRKHHGEGLRLASGAPLEPIAGESAGGAYFLCAEEDGRRPVVFASSEGEGGLIAEERTRVAAALSLRVVPVADLVIRLWEAASRTEPGYVVTTEDGEACDPPFGEYSEPHHGGWR
ncbi:hypothetical protein ACFVZN_04280 [Streptomyces virginiae]|uniref:hypothetical protein n=1 Tax=Streptomyces virginiae TaxID=1961 RepID=UPI0036C35A31